MEQLTCLYVENDLRERARFEGWIRDAWGKLETGIKIEIECVDSADEGSDIIRKRGSKFQLLFVDIFFGETEEALGIQLIKQAHSIATLAIIALSKGNVDTEHEAKAAGADEFLPKSVLSGRAAGQDLLQSTMRKVLEGKGYELISTGSTPIEFDRQYWPLSALMETIGENNLAAIVIKLLRLPCIKIDAFFVTAGLSGASVIRVDCHLQVGDTMAPDIRKVLLKVTRDGDILTREFHKREETKAFPTDLFVRFIDRPPEEVQCGGWFALGADFQTRAESLLGYLRSEHVTSEQACSTMDRLFLDGGLSEVYRPAVWRTGVLPNSELSRALTLSRKARIWLSLQELAPLATKYSASGFDDRIIKAFLESKRFGEIDEEAVKAAGTHMCRSHGDLHGRNVLVETRDGRPRLIDPANIDHLHWASDLARLSVDLIVSGIDAGPESHEWNLTDEWLALSHAFVTNSTPLPFARNGNVGVHSALDWIRSHAEEIFKPNIPFIEWEFRLALAIEFLRASYRQSDLPTPKRVVGLLSASFALRAAGEACSDWLRDHR